MIRTLFIIGNGFDLYLGIESSYSDFHRYMIKQWSDGVNLSNQLENFFPALDNNGDSLLWSDFESALGKMDKDGVLEYCKLGFNIEDYDNIYRYVYDIEDSPSSFLTPVLFELDECFHAWVNSLAIYGGDPTIPFFDRSALYFSFNYTETLENIYKVSENNICHIHGKRHSSEKYIYGHNSEKDAILGDNSADDNAFSKIEECYLGLSKDCYKQIQNNKCFFDRIKESKISRVVVYGCSLGEIDMPYFHEIKNNIPNTAEWHFSIYKKPEDVNSVLNLIKAIGLNKNLCHTFDFRK